MYPYFEEFDCSTQLVIIDLDVLREDLVEKGKGFIVHSHYRKLKKEMVNPEGLFSPKFGRSLADIDVTGNRYKCECGETISHINEGTTCKFCGTKVKYVDDDFEFMGFLKLDNNYIIHPTLFQMIKKFIGAQNLLNIITFEDNKDINGHSIVPPRTPENPYNGIGLIQFRLRFREIMDYYNNKFKFKKQDVYDIIMLNESKVFTQTIPVFSSLLRPTKIDANSLRYEPSNKLYVMMSNLVITLNKCQIRENKPKELLLFNIQTKLDELYNMIIELLSGKKGKLRGVFGGRYNFTSRIVIVPNANLKVDQVIMPYHAMLELEKQRIINILEKVHGSPAIANRIYEDSLRVTNPEIVNIINQLIKDDPTGQGIPVLVNRNPTITYGSIQQMFVVGICENYTLQMPLQILPYFNADFDGDVLNVHRIISKSFFIYCNRVFNPRNAMYISTNDGMTASSILPYKDIMINANSLQELFNAVYDQEMYDNILAAQSYPMTS